MVPLSVPRSGGATPQPLAPKCPVPKRRAESRVSRRSRRPLECYQVVRYDGTPECHDKHQRRVRLPLYLSPTRSSTSHINGTTTSTYRSVVNNISPFDGPFSRFKASPHPDRYPTIVTYSQIQFKSHSSSHRVSITHELIAFPPSFEYHFLSLITVHFQFGTPPGCGVDTPMKTSPAPLLSFPGGLVEFAVKFGI